jgi:hypothetical protein
LRHRYVRVDLKTFLLLFKHHEVMIYVHEALSPLEVRGVLLLLRLRILALPNELIRYGLGLRLQAHRLPLFLLLSRVNLLLRFYLRLS